MFIFAFRLTVTPCKRAYHNRVFSFTIECHRLIIIYGQAESLRLCLAAGFCYVSVKFLRRSIDNFRFPSYRRYLISIFIFVINDISVAVLVVFVDDFAVFVTVIDIYIPLCIYFNPVLYSPALIQQLHLLFCRSLSLYRFYHKFLLVITSFSHIRLCNLY